jgi:hypothetical protein
MSQSEEADIFEIHYRVKQKMLERITTMFRQMGRRRLSLDEHDGHSPHLM